MTAEFRSNSVRTNLGSRWALAFALLGMALSLSCGGVPRTYYYTLQTPPPPAMHDPKTGFVLGIEQFRATEALRDNRIVYYESPTQLNFYEYHRWSADPAAMLTELTGRWLGEMGVFSRIQYLPSREPVDYVLKGRVLDFEEVDSNGGAKGRVTLKLTLSRFRDQRVVWSFMREVTQPAKKKGMIGVVNAVNLATRDLLRQALPAMATVIERESKPEQTRKPNQ